MLSQKQNVPKGTQEDALGAKSIEMTEFQFYQKPITNTRQKAIWTLKEAYNYITMDMKATEHTQKLRAIENEKDAKAYKGRCFDYACFSGLFNTRDDKGLQSHSWLICLDFDHIGKERLNAVKNQLLEDPYFETWLLFVSPSGDGLKWVVDIDLHMRTHQEWFDAICRYVKKTYDLTADPQCRNVSRACFLPHDSNCYVHPEIMKQKGCVPF